MRLFGLNKSNIMLWKIVGIGIVTFLVLSSAFVNGEFYEQYHYKVMLGGFILVVTLCGLLVADALKTLRLQQEQNDTLMGTKIALVSLIELKDSYTEGHSMRVRDFATRFAAYLNLAERDIEEITLAAELHDIGKIGIPDSILKKPDKLSEKEFAEIKKHPALGADSIKSLRGFENIAKIVKHHHEKFQGTGYPDGLSSKEIPVGSRVINIVDAYDAMLHGRAYRNAFSKAEVLKIIEQEAGNQFDPALAKAFLKFIEKESVELLYDPVCGMNVQKTNKNFSKNTRIKCIIFVLKYVSESLTNPRKNIFISF